MFPSAFGSSSQLGANAPFGGAARPNTSGGSVFDSSSGLGTNAPTFGSTTAFGATANATSSRSMFGNPLPTVNTSSSSVFGSGTAFGAPAGNAGAPNASFGSVAMSGQSVFGGIPSGGGAFGQVAGVGNSAFTQMRGGDSMGPAPTAAGSTKSVFGAPNQTSTGSVFGGAPNAATSTKSVFGATNPTNTGSVFGAVGAPNAAANPAPAFGGGGQSTSVFGGGNGNSVFGGGAGTGTASAGGVFGAANRSVFGGGATAKPANSVFNVGAGNSAFGAVTAKPGNSVFGGGAAKADNSVFGAATKTTNSVFGGTGAGGSTASAFGTSGAAGLTGGAFGQPAPLQFGAAKTSAFGSKTQDANPFEVLSDSSSSASNRKEAMTPIIPSQNQASFAPMKDVPNIISGVDVSPEETRFLYWHCVNVKGDVNDYTNKFAGLLGLVNAEENKVLKNPIKAISDYNNRAIEKSKIGDVMLNEIVKATSRFQSTFSTQPDPSKPSPFTNQQAPSGPIFAAQPTVAAAPAFTSPSSQFQAQAPPPALAAIGAPAPEFSKPAGMGSFASFSFLKPNTSPAGQPPKQPMPSTNMFTGAQKPFQQQQPPAPVFAAAATGSMGGGGSATGIPPDLLEKSKMYNVKLPATLIPSEADMQQFHAQQFMKGGSGIPEAPPPASVRG
ncbi:hypothetical protein HDU76_003179 [Blyttiomyces sp. JEL0837]|nr:hypothetical protein HDU76_003179 [Blyttiomyces sp. JEL0837]